MIDDGPCMVPGCRRITVARGEGLAFCLLHHDEYRAAHPDAEMGWTHREFGNLCVERVMLAEQKAWIERRELARAARLAELRAILLVEA